MAGAVLGGGGLTLLLLTALLLVASAPGHAQPQAAPQVRRVALVVGNGAYQHTLPLTNPRNDARDMAESLRALGYEVIEGLDLDKAALDRIIHRFARALHDADAGVFFYAGHGLQVAGQNYLVPIDAKLEDASGLDFEMVRLDLVHRTMERETTTNVIFLDACRDNPLARNLSRALGTRSTQVGHGLAAVESGSGTLISFSTQPGNVALDGEGRNSPFTEALVKRIRAQAASEDLSRLLIDVRNDVMAATKNRQVPWENSALVKPFYFVSAGAPPAAATDAGSAAPYDKDIELAFWATVREAKSVVLLQTYLDRYRDGHFASLARALIGELQQEQAAKAAAAKGQAQAVAAEDARKAAAVKQLEEQHGLEVARQADELARAREKLRQATAEADKAKEEREAALRLAEEAKKQVAQAKLAQEQLIRQAEERAKAVATAPAKEASLKDMPRKETPAKLAAAPTPGAPAAVAVPARAREIRADLAGARALRTVALGNDGTQLAIAGDDTFVRLLNAADLKLLRTLKGHRERVCAVAFSPDGKLLASAGWDGAIKLWNLETGEVETLTSGADKFYSVAFDPKVPLHYVLAGDGKGAVHIWDLRKKARVGKPEEHDGPVRGIAFFPDATGTFVSIGADGKLRYRSVKTGIKDIEAHAGGGFAAVYSADGASVLTAGGDKKVKLWQSGDLHLLRTFEGNGRYVLSAAFARDGGTVASGGGEGAVLLWEAQTGKLVRRLSGHAADVEGVAFLADGKRVASVSEDKTLRLWDAATGEQLAVAVGFADGEYVAYTPDGRFTGSPGAQQHLRILQDGSERALEGADAQLNSASGLALAPR